MQKHIFIFHLSMTFLTCRHVESNTNGLYSLIKEILQLQKQRCSRILRPGIEFRCFKFRAALLMSERNGKKHANNPIYCKTTHVCLRKPAKGTGKGSGLISFGLDRVRKWNATETLQATGWPRPDGLASTGSRIVAQQRRFQHRFFSHATFTGSRSVTVWAAIGGRLAGSQLNIANRVPNGHRVGQF
jgi:hypothetical protein